jgi:unsaturated chondroitin disaccharide hydrolase
MKRRVLLLAGTGATLTALGIHQLVREWSSSVSRENLPLAQRIDLCLELARLKIADTIDWLDSFSYQGIVYPYLTKPDRPDFSIRRLLRGRGTLPNGTWMLAQPNFWSAGAFPALLWKISLLEVDPYNRGVWMAAAKKWGDPLRNDSLGHKDITLNNFFVFAPWYETAEGKEKQQALARILAGARSIARPFQDGQGSYHTDIQAFGWVRAADRTDNREHWQAFMDHTINVEQLLGAARYNPDPKEAADWQAKAIAHLRTLHRTFGANRRPGTTGTWQRGYFDHDVNSPNYKSFLFNEGKQGWRDDSTWSRGQAWWVYSTSVTYAYTGDAEMLTVAKSAIDYYLANLPDRFPGLQRKAGDFVPPWDFDYALQRDANTHRDSSAAAIAVAGIVRLLKALPTTDASYETYQTAIENILLNLTSLAYFPDETGLEMSLLRHGCYHHPKAISPSQIYDTGTIWGDYFLIDALGEYRKFLT